LTKNAWKPYEPEIQHMICGLINQLELKKQEMANLNKLRD
jgi:hypothetical protein